MQRFVFYMQYAIRSLWRNRRWSAFAMLSVAAGVATVVALRSLGLAIGDSLTSNVRATLHGDIAIERGSAGFNLNLVNDEVGDVLSSSEVAYVQRWVDERGGAMTDYRFASIQLTAAEVENPSLFNFVTALFIDPQTYPPTEDIFTIEPDGVLLGELIQTPNDVVISENLALAQDIGVGDAVRVSGTTETFTVRGIVTTETEAGLRDIFAAFFGFVYFDRRIAPEIIINSEPNRIALTLPDGTTNEEIQTAADDLNDYFERRRGTYRIISVPSLIEQNALIADIVGRLVVVMGLGAMLLGGVGIINTMLVLVRRRTNEIAALKTFGLKGRQVAFLFMTEALILGVVGSIVGTIAGAFLSRLTNAYGETFVQQQLEWQIYPESLLFGMVLGLVVTAVFGVMPVLTAVKVRPGAILRPNETHVPALGVLQSISVLIFVVLSLGIIAGQIIGPLPGDVPYLFGIPLPPNMVIGILGVTITLLLLALLAGILWIVVWLVGRLPSFGWVDLRLALNNLRSRRLRTATTLLALSTGMFALSSITFYGASFREILQFNLSESFGGNVLIISPATFTSLGAISEGAQRQLDATLDSIDGIVHRTRLVNYNGHIVEVDGVSTRVPGGLLRREQLQDEFAEAAMEGNLTRMEAIGDELTEFAIRRVTIGALETDNPDPATRPLIAGRQLTPEDEGQPVAVLVYEERFQDLGVTLGSTIQVEINRSVRNLEIVGLLEDTVQGQGGFAELSVPPGTLTGVTPDFQINTVQAEPDALSDVLLEISAVPGYFPLNVAVLDGIVSRFITQFSALPLLVGLLSLGAAAVIMANTVALATLERRKQIGILKAIGLKSKRVLGIMLLENTMVSLLGGVLGIGLSVVGVAALTFFGLDELVLIPRDARPVAVGLVVAAVIIGGTATFLSANVAVRERVLNVLRYE